MNPDTPPASDEPDVPVEISIVIPARNEEFALPRTLESAHAAGRATGAAYEIIVVDDASTDATASIAERAGARVVPVELHNIAAVRNAGAAVARGRMLFFLDADTLLPTETLLAARSALDAGAIGGGATVRFDKLTLFQRFLIALFVLLWQRLCRWAAGCSVFASRAEFEAVGGFDPQYFAAEELYLSAALKKRGRFVILREHVLTSGRKLRLFSTWYLLRLAMVTLLSGRRQLTRPQGLEILYDAPREMASGSGSENRHDQAES